MSEAIASYPSDTEEMDITDATGLLSGESSNSSKALKQKTLATSIPKSPIEEIDIADIKDTESMEHPNVSDDENRNSPDIPTLEDFFNIFDTGLEPLLGSRASTPKSKYYRYIFGEDYVTPSNLSSDSEKHSNTEFSKSPTLKPAANFGNDTSNLIPEPLNVRNSSGAEERGRERTVNPLGSAIRSDPVLQRFARLRRRDKDIFQMDDYQPVNCSEDGEAEYPDADDADDEMDEEAVLR